MSQKISIIFSALIDRGEGDPEALGLALHQDTSFINAYCQAITILVDRD